MDMGKYIEKRFNQGLTDEQIADALSNETNIEKEFLKTALEIFRIKAEQNDVEWFESLLNGSLERQYTTDEVNQGSPLTPPIFL